MKLLSSAFTVLSLSVRSSGFAPGRLLSSTRRNTVVTEQKSSSMTSQMSFIDRLLHPTFRPFHCASSSSDNIDGMSNSPVVTLVGDDLSQEHGDYKCDDSVVAFDGCVYGIPSDTRHVIKFNPKDNSTTTIGGYLGRGESKWWGGVEAKNGCIYAVPQNEYNILKIDIQRQAVEKVDAKLPQSKRNVQWGGGALGDDGCIYYFPGTANRILKLDPSNDTLSSVGNNLQTQQGGRKELFIGTVKVDDGCLIGIPYQSKRIIKFDPKEPHTTTMVGEEAEEEFECRGNGALGGDGNVYAVTRYGKILQIDVANNRHLFVAEAPESREWGWFGAVTGMDGNIYFPPDNASRVLKYDITTQQASLVGDDLGDKRDKYRGGALNRIDGKIYCLPCRAKKVLSIDTNATPQLHQNSTKRTRDQARAESSTTMADGHIRNQRRRTRMVADSSSIGSANTRHPNNIKVEEDVNEAQPHGGENDDAVDAGGNDRGGQESTTMQRLLQATRYVQMVQDMNNPHPTLLANAERMAETSAMLTDRFIEEAQNDKEESSNNDGNVHI